MDSMVAVIRNAIVSRRPVPVLVAAAIVVCCLLILAMGDAARAAPPAATIEGVPKDALERPLCGVQLKLQAPDGRVVAQPPTDASGRYRFTGIAPGVYSVIGEKQGFDTASAIASLDASNGATADLTLAAQQALDLKLIEQRLNEARLAIQPRIGASTYTIPDKAIEAQAGGENNPLSQVLLQAPGVTQDSQSQGQLHVRNEHANVQFRINGVILPEGVSVFGQALSPRFAGSVDLITGALPAEYGLRTAGIFDIQTKSGAFNPGGAVSIYGGSYGRIQPSFEYGGSVGRFNYFLPGDYLQSNLGLENPTPSYNPIPDKPQHRQRPPGRGQLSTHQQPYGALGRHRYRRTQHLQNVVDGGAGGRDRRCRGRTVCDSRQWRQDRLDLQLLSAGRVAHPAHGHRQLWRPLRRRRRLHS